MTTESRELFELCKQVYEATGLADTVDYFYLKNNGDYNVNRATHTQVDHNWWKLDGEVPTGCFPLYISDYLLEKLPKKIKRDSSTGWLVLSPMDSQGAWSAGYEPDHTEHIDDYPMEWGESTVAALLKLTLKLHEEKTL